MSGNADRNRSVGATKLTPVFSVGLTGGIASGKSTIANMFVRLGATLIDTDVIARQVVSPESDGLREVIDHFGASVLRDDGRLDRRELRKIVFADVGQRRALESILHPLIREETLGQMRRNDGTYQVVAVPLLTESPLKHSVDRILVVDCSKDVQLERLMRRDTESVSLALRMIEAQATREERLEIADDVLVNNTDLADAERQAIKLHKRYLTLAEQKLAANDVAN